MGLFGLQGQRVLCAARAAVSGGDASEAVNGQCATPTLLRAARLASMYGRKTGKLQADRHRPLPGSALQWCLLATHSAGPASHGAHGSWVGLGWKLRSRLERCAAIWGLMRRGGGEHCGPLASEGGSNNVQTSLSGRRPQAVRSLDIDLEPLEKAAAEERRPAAAPNAGMSKGA